MSLADAKSSIDLWWAEKLPKIIAAGGHRVQQGLNEQVQRLAMEQAHKLTTQHKLSEDDGMALVVYALQHCEPPWVS